MRTKNRIFAISILLVITFWVTDALVDFTFFSEGESFLDELVSPGPYEIYIRLLGTVFILIPGIIVSRIYDRHKKADTSLREINEDLKVAQHLTKIGNWKWLIATNKITWSDELCRINGWDPETPAPPFAGMDRFYTPESWKRLSGAVTEAVNTGKPYALELDQIRIDGTKLKTFSRGEADYDANGKIVSLHGTVLDITEQKALQEQLIAQDRLSSIGQLVSGVAHEINNPLTSVVGFSELLLNRDLPSDIKNDLKIIHEEAHRAAKIVKGLLYFTRQNPEGKTMVDINQIIQQALDLRTYEQQVNNIQVKTGFAESLPQIMGNASQLHQVFFNLIVNAEQAVLEAHGKGTINITTKQSGDNIRISVSDDGPGISPENMGKLFTPFFTTKGTGKGTGLGLSICHGIITEHGGSLYAESEVGKGAVFTIELPVPDKQT